MKNFVSGIIVVVSLSTGRVVYAQDPYLRPPIAQREVLADSSGALPQLDVAMTNANVVDVRSGEILAGVTVRVRDGMIVTVGDAPPPRNVPSCPV